jgi:hypothetical protein
MNKHARDRVRRLSRDYKYYDYTMNEALLRMSHPSWFN